MHPSAFYSTGISDRRTSIALTWNAMMKTRQRKTDLRCAVSSRRSDPQGIDNLRAIAGCGIISDDLAATTLSMDRQIPSRRPGGMARRRPRNLQHPMLMR